MQRASVLQKCNLEVGEKNFGEFLPIRQIRQNFLPPSFSSVRTENRIPSSIN